VLACAIVNAHLDYCNALLYDVSAKNVQRLQRIQNSLARAQCTICFIGYSHKKDNIQDRNNHTSNSPYTTTCFLAELIHESAPVWSLRSSDRHLLHQPRTDTVTASRAFAVAAPGIWNSLPVSVTACINYCTFKPNLRLTYFPPLRTKQQRLWLVFNELWRYSLYTFLFVLVLYHISKLTVYSS